MKLPSIFKTPNYQRFDIKPRYYDPIKEEIEENPALEEGENIVEADTQDQDPEESVESDLESEDEPVIDDEMEVVDYIQEYLDNEDDTPDYKLQGDGYNPEEEEKSMPVVLENSFYDFVIISQ